MAWNERSRWNGTRKELEQEGGWKGETENFIDPRKIKPYRYMPEDSPEVIEPYTPSGYIIWWGLQSSPLCFSFPSIIRYKYLACRLDSARQTPMQTQDSLAALYSSLHSRSRRAQTTNYALAFAYLIRGYNVREEMLRHWVTLRAPDARCLSPHAFSFFFVFFSRNCSIFFFGYMWH